MSDVAIIIRLCYAPGFDEEARAWRFAFFREHVLPRLFPQGDVWVWAHPKDALEVRSMGVRTFTVDPACPPVIFENTTLTGYPWRAVRGLPKYRVQVLMGSDDLISPDFVATCLRAMGDKPRALATVLPIILDWESGRLFETRQWSRPSPFVVMRQPLNDPRYTWVWAEDHRKLGRLVRPVIYLPAGNAVMTVHGFNDGTGLGGGKRELPRSAVAWL